jgi:hypothetical protein
MAWSEKKEINERYEYNKREMARRGEARRVHGVVCRGVVVVRWTTWRGRWTREEKMGVVCRPVDDEALKRTDWLELQHRWNVVTCGPAGHLLPWRY